MIGGSENLTFVLDAGEERKLSIAATVPPYSGSYELVVQVRVFTDEQYEETEHSDGAYQVTRIEIR